MVGDINCSCLGITGFPETHGKDMPACNPEDFESGVKKRGHIGSGALNALDARRDNLQQSSLSNVQHRDLNKEYHEEMDKCCENHNELLAETCALQKIRGELYEMEGLTSCMTDCEVSKWIDEDAPPPEPLEVRGEGEGSLRCMYIGGVGGETKTTPCEEIRSGECAHRV